MLVVRRVLSSDGKSRCFINDQPVGVALLRTIAPALVELHGQQDDRGLLNPRGHRALLDAFGGHGAALRDVRSAWRARLAAAARLGEARAALDTLRAEEDYLRHAVGELDALAPAPGEDAEAAHSAWE